MNHWDEKYQTEDYIYGKEANAYLQSIFNRPTNKHEKVVLLAEGEGRNAVYLAELGYVVTTYDTSEKGIDKQQRLANEKGVEIEAHLGDITAEDAIPKDTYDYSINIFGHVPSEGKAMMFTNLVSSLVPHGHSYFEFYAKDQLQMGTGGPKDIDMLYDVDEIKAILATLPVHIHALDQHQVVRNEGSKHRGEGIVIQGHIEKI
ncbi:methyltransferase domain-containing protein [Staphylococcus chromogenes]|uniref:class I SAM-dependent methyltransferase n=1 Tax=Staphylococcus chromogenes TaxID=46126 RepID=UPI001E415B2D|nr:class I SAM-dependent methyltransferase [Staphylococcus chromogenes]MCD8904158.1 methyltransferase domain-containing protein [Staphylococcus chromogenes]